MHPIVVLVLGVVALGVAVATTIKFAKKRKK